MVGKKGVGIDFLSFSMIATILFNSRLSFYFGMKFLFYLFFLFIFWYGCFCTFVCFRFFFFFFFLF